MSNKFESREWHAAVADVVTATGSNDVAGALADAIGVAVKHEGTCLIAFHRDRSPQVVHHTLEPAGAQHYLDRYLAGPYLLDPLYQLALSATKPAWCRYREASPDRFRSSEYYRQYCERTHLRDEIDYLADVENDTTLALVVGRRTGVFSKAELRRLELIEPFVQAAIWECWRQQSTSSVREQESVALHRRLTECFDGFGASVLTRREREISQFLLRGHSSKSVARELSIAPGTVMVHKRNLFAKLGISSQYELFSLFIDELGR